MGGGRFLRGGGNLLSSQTNFRHEKINPKISKNDISTVRFLAPQRRRSEALINSDRDGRFLFLLYQQPFVEFSETLNLNKNSWMQGRNPNLQFQHQNMIHFNCANLLSEFTE